MALQEIEQMQKTTIRKSFSNMMTDAIYLILRFLIYFPCPGQNLLGREEG